MVFQCGWRLAASEAVLPLAGSSIGKGLRGDLNPNQLGRFRRRLRVKDLDFVAGLVFYLMGSSINVAMCSIAQLSGR